jgi:hypothetical protein
MQCTGDGRCFTQCYCICYNKDTDEDHPICICGHRTHGTEYCRKEPCIYKCRYIQCKNFVICGISMPKWSMEQIPVGNMCFNCWAYRGNMEASQIEECIICNMEKQVIVLQCHSTHKICLECWDKATHSKKYPSTCPFCRKDIGGWKCNSSE